LSLIELYEVFDMTVIGPDRPITTKARVVWSRNEVPPGLEKDMPRGMGVEFVKISDEDQETITSFLSEFSEAEALNEGEGDKILEEEQLVQDEKEYKADREDKSNLTLAPPKQCSRGHKHLSWSPGSDHVFVGTATRSMRSPSVLTLGIRKSRTRLENNQAGNRSFRPVTINSQCLFSYLKTRRHTGLLNHYLS
jgi:hypothetical protein